MTSFAHSCEARANGATYVETERVKTEVRARVFRMGLLVLLSVVPIAALRFATARELLAGFIEFLRTAGAAGLLVYFLVYLVGVVLVMPVWLLSGIAGYAYGFGPGLAVAIVVLTFASTVIFLGLRALPGAHRSEDRVGLVVRTVLAEHPAAGMRLTLLLRLAPLMPQNGLTYLLASVPLKLADFVVGTFFGLLPFTALHAYVGSLVENAAALVTGSKAMPSTLQWCGLAGGAILIAAAVVVVLRAARRAMDQLDPSSRAGDLG